jgi:hypothetical protein
MDANNKSPLVAPEWLEAGALVALFALAFAIAFAPIETSWLPLSLIVFAVLLIVLDLRTGPRAVSLSDRAANAVAAKFPGLNSQLVPRPRIFDEQNHA